MAGRCWCRISTGGELTEDLYSSTALYSATTFSGLQTAVAQTRMENPSPKHPPQDADRGPMVLAISWLTASIAVVTVASRFHFRYSKHGHGWDDYFSYAGLVRLPLDEDNRLFTDR